MIKLGITVFEIEAAVFTVIMFQYFFNWNKFYNF